MAKYVLAGKSSCPLYARAEALADELSLRLPDFSVHKIAVHPEAWSTWVSSLCQANNWSHDGSSPIIWRELVNRGGKGILLGGCNDLLELAKGYYGLTCDIDTAILKSLASENEQTKLHDDQAALQLARSRNPYRVVITNPQCTCAYLAIPRLLTEFGRLRFSDVSVSLFVSDLNSYEEVFQSVHAIRMEVEDCVFSTVEEVKVSLSFEDVSMDADLVVVLDGLDGYGKPRDKIHEEQHFKLMRKYGEILDRVARKTVKILSAGLTPLQDCYVMSQFALRLTAKNFFASTRVAENRIKMLSKKLNVKPSQVQNVIVWGDPAVDIFIDVSQATVQGYDGAIWGPHISSFSHRVKDVTYDGSWLTEELPSQLKQNVEISKSCAGCGSLALSAALESQMVDLHSASPDGLLHSLGLVSKGWYGVPEGIVFSFPVTFSNDGVAVKESVLMEKEVLDGLLIVSKQVQDNCKRVMEYVK